MVEFLPFLFSFTINPEDELDENQLSILSLLPPVSHKSREISKQVSSLFKQGNFTKALILIQINILKKEFSFNHKDTSLDICKEQLPEQVVVYSNEV